MMARTGYVESTPSNEVPEREGYGDRMADKPEPPAQDERETPAKDKPGRRDAVQRAYDVVQKAVAPHEPKDDEDPE